MVSYTNSSALENRSVEVLDPLVPPDFWFDLKSFLHFSWLEKSEFSGVLLQGDKKVSGPAWNLLYRNICREVGIASNFTVESSSEDAFLFGLAEKILSTPLLPMRFVGACMRVQNDLSLMEFSEKPEEGLKGGNQSINAEVIRYPVTQFIELSLPQKKAAFHARNCFALDRRFKSLMMTDDILTGLCFFQLFLSKENLSLWERLRLIYDKKIISYVEKHVENEVLNPASYRCLKRLWRFTGDTVLKN